MKTSIEIARAVHFSSGHTYQAKALSERENQQAYGSAYKPGGGLGHNFTLQAYLTGPVLESTGMILDLRIIDKVLKEVVGELDHHYLNDDVEYFKSHPPTAENIARYCFDRLKTRFDLAGAELTRVRLFEGDNFWVDYCG